MIHIRTTDSFCRHFRDITFSYESNDLESTVVVVHNKQTFLTRRGADRWTNKTICDILTNEQIIVYT